VQVGTGEDQTGAKTRVAPELSPGESQHHEDRQRARQGRDAAVQPREQGRVLLELLQDAVPACGVPARECGHHRGVDRSHHEEPARAVQQVVVRIDVAALHGRQHVPHLAARVRVVVQQGALGIAEVEVEAQGCEAQTRGEQQDSGRQEMREIKPARGRGRSRERRRLGGAVPGAHPEVVTGEREGQSSGRLDVRRPRDRRARGADKTQE